MADVFPDEDDSVSLESEFHHNPDDPIWLLDIKHGLFAVLFALVKDCPKSVALEGFFTLVQGIQMTAFCFSNVFPWSEQIIFKYFRQIFLWMSVDMFSGAYWEFFIAVIALICLLMGNIGVVAYLFATDNFSITWPINLLRLVTSVFSTVLIIPSLGVVTSVLFNCAYLECNITGFAVRILSCFVVLLFVVYSLFISSIDHDISPYLVSPISRPSSRIHFFELVMKILLIILYSALSNSSYVWALVPVLVIINVFSFLLFFLYPPYYSFTFSFFACCIRSIQAWASLCLIVTVVENNYESNSSVLLFFLTSPFVISVTYFLFYLRCEHVVAHDSESVMELDLKIRYLLYPYLKQVIEDPKLLDASDFVHLFPEISDDCVTEFQIALQKFPHSCALFLALAQFRYFILNDKKLARDSLVKSSFCEPLIDESFMIYRFQRIVDEKLILGSERVDLISSIQLQKYHQMILHYDFLACKAYTLFCYELLQDSPSLYMLEHLSAKIIDAVALETENFEVLLKSSDSSAELYRNYADFLLNLVNNCSKGRKMLEDALRLDKGLSFERKSTYIESEIVDSSNRNGDHYKLSLKYRTMIEEKSKENDFSLRYFKYLLQIGILLLLGLAVLSFMIFRYTSNNFLISLSALHDCGIRSVGIIETVFHVKTLLLVQRNLVHKSFEFISRQNLTTLVNSLSSFQLTMLSNIPDDVANLYSISTVTILELVNDVTVTRTVNFIDAFKMFVSQASQIVHMPLNECNMLNPIVFFVVHNGLQDLLSVSNSSVYLLDSELGGYYLHNVSLYFLISVAVFLAIVFLVLSLTEYRLESANFYVIKTFLKVPTECVKSLSKQIEDRLKSVHDFSWAHNSIETEIAASERKNITSNNSESRFFSIIFHQNNVAATIGNEIINFFRFIYQPMLVLFTVVSASFFIVALYLTFNLSTFYTNFFRIVEYNIQATSYLSLSYLAIRDYVTLNQTTFSSNIIAINSSPVGFNVTYGAGSNSLNEFKVSDVLKCFDSYSYFDDTCTLGDTYAVKQFTDLETYAFINGCGSFSSSGCDTFYYQIMSQGYYGASQLFYSFGTSLVLSMNRTYSSPTDSSFVLPDSLMYEIMQQESMQYLDVSQRLYLKEAQVAVALSVFESFQARHTNIVYLLGSILGGYIGCHVIFYYFALKNKIEDLNQNLSRTKSILLMIPSFVIQETPSLLDYISQK